MFLCMEVLDIPALLKTTGMVFTDGVSSRFFNYSESLFHSTGFKVSSSPALSTFHYNAMQPRHDLFFSVRKDILCLTTLLFRAGGSRID